MLNGSIFTIITGIIWTLLAIVYSSIAAKNKTISGIMFVYSLVFAAAIWIFQFPQNAPATEIGKVALCVIPSALLGQLGFFALYLAMKKGSHAVAWTFTQSAMVIPFLACWFLFDNKVKWFNVTGLFLIMIALCGQGMSKKSESTAEKKNSAAVLFFSILALITVGIGQFASLIPGELNMNEAALSWRLPLMTVVGIIIWGGAVVITRAKLNWQGIKKGGNYGIAAAAGQVTLYIAIDQLTPVNMVAIVYPAALSICIILFAIYCAIFRKEKISLLAGISLFLLLAGVTLLFWQ